MSSTATNSWSEMQVANSSGGLAIGRGTGLTLKEFNRRLTEMMRRKRVESHAWRKKRKPGCKPAPQVIPD